MIHCSKLREVIIVSLTSKQPLDKIRLVWERFIASAFFELVFYPSDMMGGSNTPGISRKPEPFRILE